MKNFKFTIEGKAYEVTVKEKGANLAEVSVNGKTFSVEIEDMNKEQIPKAISRPAAAVPKMQTATAVPVSVPKAAAGAGSVKSPLPGTIFKIEVSAGQTVKKGDLLLVMEAMKMENNILAAKDGVVKAVHVQVGQTVLPGDVLVDVE
jgi:biotin carboxyl carrier protein